MAARNTEGTTAEPSRTVVYLGNSKAVQLVDGERQPLHGARRTDVILPADISLIDALRDITSPQGIWAAHSDADAPTWVAAEGPLAEPVAALLAAQYPGVEIRDPATVEEG